MSGFEDWLKTEFTAACAEKGDKVTVEGNRVRIESTDGTFLYDCVRCGGTFISKFSDDGEADEAALAGKAVCDGCWKEGRT